MAWMMDTYSMQKGYAVPEIVTGKPISIGGSIFRHEATGAGVVMVIARACERLGWELAEPALRRAGLRQRGRRRRARAAGARRDRDRGLRRLRRASYDDGGLDVPALMAYAGRAAARSRAGREVDRVPNDELLELPCDILVLAAREDQLHADNAARIQARLVAEGANGPTSIEADAILARARHPRPPGHPHERGRRDRLVLRVGAGPRAPLLGPRRDPRRSSPRSWTTPSTASGRSPSEHGIPLRTAALVAGIREVASALELRGIYP